MRSVPLPRSFLYVPANRPGLFDKGAQGPADAIILDLEDAVPLREKEGAREAAAQWLGATDWNGRKGAEVWARVNAESITQDVAAVVHSGLDGVFLAKCTPETLEELSRAIAATGRGGRTQQPVAVIGLVETAQGLLSVAEMAQTPGVATFGIGEVDLLGDMRITFTSRSTAAVDQLRTQLVLQCAATGLQAPVAPTSTAFRDLEGFHESSRKMLDLGFRSRTAIHPDQVGVIHEVFTPTEEEVRSALDVLRRFEAADEGVTTDEDGRLIDAAVVRQARETLGRRPG